MNKFFPLIILVILISCSSDSESISNTNQENANYKVTVTMNWSEANFPTDYPNGAHFSRLIGWTHKTNSDFFKEGTIASAGIRNMAETGNISPLDDEINNKIVNNEGLQLIISNGLSSGTGMIETEITVNKDNPSVTLSSMIAPSPDWYVALVNENLLENGTFIESKIATAFAYDAGTDSGTTYTSTNLVTSPQSAIQKITSSPLNESIAIATVTFTKI